MRTDVLSISNTSKFISCTIVDLTVKIMVTVLALGVICLASVDAWVSLAYGLPYQNAGFTFLQNATFPALGVVCNLGLIAAPFALLALVARWFLLQASCLAASGKKSRIRRLLILATRICTPNSLVNRRLTLLAGGLSLTTPNRVLLTTSAGLSGATPLLI